MDRRYPIASEVEYRIVRGKRVLDSGRGRTVNISGSGILFQSNRPLVTGSRIELAVTWPMYLDDSIPLRLWILGRTVRSDGNQTAVEILRYDFRTQGRKAHAKRTNGNAEPA